MHIDQSLGIFTLLVVVGLTSCREAAFFSSLSHIIIPRLCALKHFEAGQHCLYLAIFSLLQSLQSAKWTMSW